MPVLSGDDCVRALKRAGYTVLRQRGSHIRLACPGRPPVTVPMHTTLDRGTLAAILRTTQISIEQFLVLRG
ncbi:MAG: type II toxin-antitoxin system HicA family toxin [Myxococcota bacterium]